MAIGEAYVLEIVVLASGTHAFLHGNRALVVALLDPKKNVLELVHARIRKEQSRIADGHKRRTAHDAMTVLCEIIQKCAANFVSCEHLCGFVSNYGRRI